MRLAEQIDRGHDRPITTGDFAHVHLNRHRRPAKPLTFRRYKDGDAKPLAWQQADFRRRPFAQVPDLHPEHAAVPGQLPVGRGHPRLPEHRARHREAARRHALAGIRLAPPDRGQPLPFGDGPRLPGAVRIRLQPQRGRGLRRHQLGRALPRRIRDREQAGLPEARRSRPARRWRSSAAARPACRRPTSWRCKGHAVTIFDERAELGGMMRYGIPGFRTPRDVLDAEIQRILDLGVQGAHELPHRHRRHAWSRSAPTSTRCSSAWARRPAGRCRWKAADAPNVRHRHRLPEGLQRRPPAPRRQARGGGRRRRHLDRRRHRGAPPRPHRQGPRVRPPRARHRRPRWPTTSPTVSASARAPRSR